MATESEIEASVSEILAKMDAQGINFDTGMHNPVSGEYGYGCVIEKPYGVSVVIHSTLDNCADLSYLEESDYPEDREILEHVESYVIWVIVRDGNTVVDYETVGGVDIDGRGTFRTMSAWLGDTALEMLDEAELEIDAAVKAAGERIARYI